MSKVELAGALSQPECGEFCRGFYASGHNHCKLKTPDMHLNKLIPYTVPPMLRELDGRWVKLSLELFSGPSLPCQVVLKTGPDEYRPLTGGAGL